MTQMIDAKKGLITEQMKVVAENEGVSEEFIRNSVASGRIVIPINVNRIVNPCGIGNNK